VESLIVLSGCTTIAFIWDGTAIVKVKKSQVGGLNELRGD
jgi:hypothetical protein